MNYDITFREQDILPFLSIVLSAFFFSFYWFIYSSEKIKKRFYQKHKEDEAGVQHILFTKYAGFVILGIFPAITFLVLFPKYKFSNYGIAFNKGNYLLVLFWSIGLGLAIIVMNWFAAQRPKTLLKYPEIRVKYWDKKLIFQYSLAWCVYLIGYEFLFRGILFFPLVNTLGVWNAIAINIALYSATHIPKGLDETVGAAILGFILCLITLQTGTIWVALFAHIILALSNFLFALKFNPYFIIADKRIR